MLLDIVEYCETWFNIYTVDAVDAMTRFTFRQTDIRTTDNSLPCRPNNYLNVLNHFRS